MSNVLDFVYGDNGFYTGHITDEGDLTEIRSIVREHYLLNIANDFPLFYDEYQKVPMHDYHKVRSDMDHSSYWAKRRRILPPTLLKKFKATRLFEWILEQCGPFKISGEDGNYEEEVYWRIVRPMQAEDVGPLHADRWFWELNSDQSSAPLERVKVWIPLHCEKSMSGFVYVPGSHLINVQYKKNFRHGKWKPEILENLSTSCVCYAGCEGQPIIFNDNLIHGGITLGNKTRVSIEFTILRDKSTKEGY